MSFEDTLQERSRVETRAGVSAIFGGARELIPNGNFRGGLGRGSVESRTRGAGTMGPQKGPDSV